MDPALIVSLVEKKLRATRPETALDIIRYVVYLSGPNPEKFIYVLQRVIDVCAGLMDPRTLVHLEFLVHENLAHLIAEEMHALAKPKCCGLL